jgi:hypothetical protein
MAVQRAVLHHQDLAVALDDLCLDLANLLVEEHGDVFLPVEDLLPCFPGAGGAERVRLARPSERRLGLLMRLEERFVGPARRERGVLVNPVGDRKHLPDAVGGNRQPLFHVLYWRMHANALLKGPVTGLGLSGPA